MNLEPRIGLYTIVFKYCISYYSIIINNFWSTTRCYGTAKHARKIYRRALERVWDDAEVVGAAFERFEQTEGDVETMDDFMKRYNTR